ncbi:hypothetical protein [Pyrobaculum aerophilum]|uniref:Uncharacterized protein n=1 Tax=Pyrobaculum aerophilum TaxID=13773 RepID=A0A371R5C7_9CREN|nr:hypothetical protein [Pyrobaculum aerophilum]RFA98267.1 hypothetical protein CGL51_00860 [Pyrobaculum aerophilum]RFA99292.1 hypothetical protein CGL52_03685 [Pyrobaculum aerophilum]
MVVTFREEGCFIFGTTRLTAEALYILRGCALAGWTALAALYGSALPLPYHPPVLQFVCQSLEDVVARAKQTSIRVWRGKARLSLGTRLGKEAEVIEGAVPSREFKCGLYIQSYAEAVEHIATYGPGKRYLKLLPKYLLYWDLNSL